MNAIGEPSEQTTNVEIIVVINQLNSECYILIQIQGNSDIFDFSDMFSDVS